MMTSQGVGHALASCPSRYLFCHKINSRSSQKNELGGKIHSGYDKESRIQSGEK